MYGVEFASGSKTTATDLLVNRGNVTLETAAGSTASAIYDLNDELIVGGGTLVIAESWHYFSRPAFYLVAFGKLHGHNVTQE